MYISQITKIVKKYLSNFRSSDELIFEDCALCFCRWYEKKDQSNQSLFTCHASQESRFASNVTGLRNANRIHIVNSILLLICLLCWLWYVASMNAWQKHFDKYIRASQWFRIQKRTSYLFNIFVSWMDVDTLALDLFGQLVHDSQRNLRLHSLGTYVCDVCTTAIWYNDDVNSWMTEDVQQRHTYYQSLSIADGKREKKLKRQTRMTSFFSLSIWIDYFWRKRISCKRWIFFLSLFCA